MPQLAMQDVATARAGAEREKALRILAKSIYKELRAQGYDHRQVVALATELIAQVTSDLQTDR